jgi:acetyl esterase
MPCHTVSRDEDQGADRGGAVSEIEVEDLALPVAGGGPLLVRVYRPAKLDGPVPVVLFLTSADGDESARSLAAGGAEAVVVPECLDGREDLVARAAAVLAWIVRDGERRMLDPAQVRLVCDGAGDELLAALSGTISL